MSIMDFKCDDCGKEVRLPDDTFEGAIVCPHCQKVYEIDIKYGALGPEPTLIYLEHVKIKEKFEVLPITSLSPSAFSEPLPHISSPDSSHAWASAPAFS